MHLLTPLLVALLFATSSLAATIPHRRRQNDLPIPDPCVPNPEMPSIEVEARFKDFTEAFVMKKDISKGFEFIAADYINHNPAAPDRETAWQQMSPLWDNMANTPERMKWQDPFGYLQWQADFGTVVDRFRWEGGCIVEHWYDGEVFPEGGEDIPVDRT